MAKVSWPDRKHIKQVLRDAHTPSMWDKFPERETKDCDALKTHTEPLCPPGVKFLILNIQCLLLPVSARAGYSFFIDIYERGRSVESIADQYHITLSAVHMGVDDMLNEAIRKMKQGDAATCAWVYAEMYPYQFYENVKRTIDKVRIIC